MPTAFASHVPLIRDVPDFPKKGIVFKDITPLLQHGPALRAAIDGLIAATGHLDAEVMLGIESRGFLFAAPMAYATGKGVALVRKPGKLPAICVKKEYALEYGSDRIEIHVDAIQPGDRVLLVDDLIASGGTAEAAAGLIQEMGGEVVECCFVIDLPDVGGRARLEKLGHKVFALCEFGGD